jgi:hypothetical protein
MTEEVNMLTSNQIFCLKVKNTLKGIYNNVLARVNQNPELLLYVLNKVNSEMYEEYKRDYDMEYRNYHGKPKQRKERAERTAARERLIRQGKV